jgi:hypothetical protein
MAVDDVDHVLQPNSNAVHASSVDPLERRLTFQHFSTDNIVVRAAAPHNCDARLSDVADWPPDLIFDAAYGIAALKAWGTQTFKTFIRNATRAIYYGDEDNGGDENGGGDDTNHANVDQEQPAVPSGRAERAAKRAKTRNGASNTKKSPDFHDMLLGIWMLNGDQRKAHAVKAEKTKEKVQTWLDSAV